MKITSILFGMCLLLFFSCTTPATEEKVDTEKVKADITAIEAAWAKASNEKDVETVLSYIAEDAISYPAHKQPEKGKAAIKSAMEMNIAKDTMNNTAQFQTLEVFAAGNYVTEIGNWKSMDATGKVVDEGNYMALFEMRDSNYVVIRDMWNSTMPKEAPQPITATE